MQRDKLPPLREASQRFKHARKASGLTQADAASAIHRSRTVVWEIEAGKRDPDDDEFTLLADLYRVPEEWLRGAPKVGRNGMTNGPVPTDLRGRCLFDEELHERVLATTSLDELQELLPSSHSSGLRTTVAVPVSDSYRFISWPEAQAKQQAVDRHVENLLAGANGATASAPEQVAFNRTLAGKVVQAVESRDKKAAESLLNHRPYFLDLLVMAGVEDLEPADFTAGTEESHEIMRSFERAFPKLVMAWRKRHDPFG